MSNCRNGMILCLVCQIIALFKHQMLSSSHYSSAESFHIFLSVYSYCNFLALCHFIHSLGISSYRCFYSCQQPLKQHHIFYIHCTVNSLSKALHFQLLLHQLDWRIKPKSFSSTVLHKERPQLMEGLSIFPVRNCALTTLVQNWGYWEGVCSFYIVPMNISLWKNHAAGQWSVP